MSEQDNLPFLEENQEIPAIYRFQDGPNRPPSLSPILKNTDELHDQYPKTPPYYLTPLNKWSHDHKQFE